MLKMKRNVEFEIRVKAGTNVEMKDEVFIAQIAAAVGRAELSANAENVRFHFEMGPTIEDLQIEDLQIDELMQKEITDEVEEEKKRELINDVEENAE